MATLEDHFAVINEKIKKGRVVLFLGAGASVSSKAPLQAKLVEAIKHDFPKVDVNKTNLLDVCQDFVETPGYDLKDLEEFITKQFRDLKPTPEHMSIAKYNWPAIFTTNYDDLIETSYRMADKPLKTSYIVSYPNEVPLLDPSKVYIFKIMGTITTRPDNKMVLCRSDFTKMIRKRAEYLRHLEDFVKDGTIVFIGYSTTDHLVTDLIEEVISDIGIQRLPWSYVLLKDLNLSEKDKFRFQSHKLIPVQCTFEDFFKRLENVPATEIVAPARREKGEKLIIEGKELFFDRLDLEVFQEYFEILHEGLIHAKSANKDDFFKGLISYYPYYYDDLDFKRDIYFKSMVQDKIQKTSITARVNSELQKKDMDDNRVIVITGPPGVGKSVLLRRLAYDVYSTGKAPVIFFDKNRVFYDYKLLSSVLVTLDRKFDEACKGKETHRLKTLIIIDNLSIDPTLVKDYLSSRGRLALIVVAARENELLDPSNIFNDKDAYRISERLSNDEKKRMGDHLLKLGYFHSADENWDHLVDKEFENSFFATIYSLVQPSRKPLTEIIYSQYVQLLPKSKHAFSFICALNQFDLPLNLELLVRALECTYEEFYNEILPNTKGLIFEESRKGYILYTAHHRIIARKTIEIFFGLSKLQKDLFLRLLSNVNLHNSKEREIVQKLLIGHLSSASRSTDLSRQERIEIFKKVCSQYETKALMHHLGVLLSDENQFAEAEEVLKKALALHEGGRTILRSELDQNILTSLGVLHSKIATQYLRDKNKFPKEFVDHEVKLAESFFLKARFGGWPNAHSYHAHANMFLQLGDIIDDDLEKAGMYSSALSIIQDANDNLNKDQLQIIYELELVLLERTGKLNLSIEKATQIAERYHSARGYTLFAATLIDRSEELLTYPDREPLLKRAMATIEKSLEQFPNDERSLVLKSKLVRRLHPNDITLYFNSLQAWYNSSSSLNIWLLFELAVAAFKLQQYEYSRRIFEKLENETISGGIKDRFQELLYLGPNGYPLIFVGVIISMENRYDGFIRCDTLNNLNYPLHFRPIACDFQPAEGDQVEFNIAFDYLGPRATRVKRI